MALAFEAEAQQVDAEPDGRIRVMVTGSNIPTLDRETAVPVQVITREEIQRANIQTAAQLANTISAAVSFGTFTENQVNANSGSPGLAAVGLRGLTFQRTLILINGRRIANYAFSGTATDLNVIPVAAIERVEVLKDGASAIYGADAIGGVINFILLDEFRGVAASAQYSAPQDPGGWSNHFNVTAGYGSLAQQKFDVYGMLDYQVFGTLTARDRDASKTFYIPGNFDQTGTSSFPANVTIPNLGPRNPTGDPANGYRNPTCAPPISFPTANNPNRCNFDGAYWLNTINPSERFATTGALTWQFAPEHLFYAQGLYARNTFTYASTPTNLQPRLPASSPFYPREFAQYFALDGQPLSYQLRSPELGGRTSEPVIEQWNAVAGVKGNVAGWRYDVAYTYGVNEIDNRYTSGFVLTSAIAPLLASGRVNPFGTNTPEVVDALEATQFIGTASEGKSSLSMLDARAWNSIFDLPAGPVSLALGAEARQWRLTSTSSSALARGDIANAGTSPSLSAVRDIWAVFAEVNAPLAKTFEANFALRYDHYNDVGGATNPKVSLRWQPDRTLLFRASAGTGFRAPSLISMYQPTTIVDSALLSDPARCPTTNNFTRDCNVAFKTLGGGDPDLKSENSSQWGVGGIWSPSPFVALGADFFQIVVEDLISGSTVQDILAGCPNGVTGTTCSRIVRGPVQPEYPTLPGPIQLIKGTLFNLGTIRTQGIDVTAQLKTPPTPYGDFSLALQGTYILRYLQQQLDGSYANLLNQEISTGANGAIPYWHHYLTLNWNAGPWGATITENFVKGTWDAFVDATTKERRRIGNYDIWNLSASYSMMTGLQLSLGVKNVFDRDPPFSNQTWSTNNNGAAGGYDPTYANPVGRVFWAELRYRFR
ncbi:MAG: TonB-dependent receptor [Burkholderiales bacterium]|nr:TonB-dependent receptor [Burkholderiales bacterium]